VRAGDVIQAGIVFAGERLLLTVPAFAAINLVLVGGWVAVVGLINSTSATPARKPAREPATNWEVDDDRWTVPINVIVSKLSSFGTFPASYAIGFGTFAAHPEIGPSWKIRGAITILLPRTRR
jgi:hypothetical protein